MKNEPIITSERRNWAVVGFLPGLLGGLLFAVTLFFLNPDLEFSFVSVARSLAFFGPLGGAISLLLHLPLSSARHLGPWRLLPWTITTVLAGTALLYWTYASRFSFYLPPTLDNRLIKAAVWVSLLALVSFYTALLHTLHSRPYSRRSRGLMVACALLAVALSLERRGAFSPESQPLPRSLASVSLEPPRLILVGIETATLDAILPLAERGRLPFLANLLQQGAYGRLTSFEPTKHTPLWTTLGTGQYPFRHGVVAEDSRRAPFAGPEAEIHLEPWGLAMPAWGGLLGMSSLGRPPPGHTPALWDILERSGLRTALVSWPASQTSLAGASLVLTDDFFNGREPTPVDRRSGWLVRAREREQGPDNVDPALFARFGDDPPTAVRLAVARDLWREQMAREILESGEADALLLYLPGLEAVSREFFGGYMAAQFEGLQDERLDEATTLVSAYYSHLDDSLRRLWESGDGPKLLAVASIWGAAEAGPVAQIVSTLSGRGPAITGRSDNAPDGALLLLGENLASGTFLQDAGIIDVAPTLLYGLGLPITSNVDGQVLTRAYSGSFLNRTPLTFVPSFPR